MKMDLQVVREKDVIFGFIAPQGENDCLMFQCQQGGMFFEANTALMGRSRLEETLTDMAKGEFYADVMHINPLVKGVSLPTLINGLLVQVSRDVMAIVLTAKSEQGWQGLYTWCRATEEQARKIVSARLMVVSPGLAWRF